MATMTRREALQTLFLNGVGRLLLPPAPALEPQPTSPEPEPVRFVSLDAGVASMPELDLEPESGEELSKTQENLLKSKPQACTEGERRAIAFRWAAVEYARRPIGKETRS